MGIEGIAMRDRPAATPKKRARDFHAARRHSRWVRFAKIVIPFGALLAVALIMLGAYLNPFRDVEGLTVGAVSLEGTSVTMESPKLTGFKNDSRPYEVTASAATQDVKRPNVVELKDLRARIVTDDRGGAARLQADTGTLDTRREQLNLRQNVRVRTDAGQEVNLRSALVDFKAGTVVSREPVVVNLANGMIEASGVEVSDNGRVLRFQGRVSTTFSGPMNPSSSNPSSSNPSSSSPSSSAPAGQGPTAPAAQPSSQRP